MNTRTADSDQRTDPYSPHAGRSSSRRRSRPAAVPCLGGDGPPANNIVPGTRKGFLPGWGVTSTGRRGGLFLARAGMAPVPVASVAVWCGCGEYRLVY